MTGPNGTSEPHDTMLRRPAHAAAYSLASQLPPDVVPVADGVLPATEPAVPLPASSVLFDEARQIAQGHRLSLVRRERPAVVAEDLMDLALDE